jgi:hypothetical protein
MKKKCLHLSIAAIAIMILSSGCYDSGTEGAPMEISGLNSHARNLKYTIVNPSCIPDLWDTNASSGTIDGEDTIPVYVISNSFKCILMSSHGVLVVSDFAILKRKGVGHSTWACVSKNDCRNAIAIPLSDSACMKKLTMENENFKMDIAISIEKTIYSGTKNGTKKCLITFNISTKKDGDVKLPSLTLPPVQFTMNVEKTDYDITKDSPLEVLTPIP